MRSTSLLAAHDRAGDDFLERPAAEVLAGAGAPPPLVARLATALAGRYEIERELGRGGMATVYLARDLRHDRRVAIKVLREELAAAVGAERFLEEIRVTASLQHPHILPLFDSGSADGLLWYVMPFVEGETLRSRLARERRLPVDVALQLAREMADALEYAHRHGVVHRDVKPENVLLQSGHALVADFGIALALEHAGGERLTRTGITLGTPQYMAPEQAAGERASRRAHRRLRARRGAARDARGRAAVRGGVAAGRAAARDARAGRSAGDAPRRRAVVRSMPRCRGRWRSSPTTGFPSAAAFAAALAVPLRRRHELRVRRSARTPRFPRARRSYAAARDGRHRPCGRLGARQLITRGALGRRRVRRCELDVGRRGRAGPRHDRRTLSLTVVDRAGRTQRTIPASRPWTPRFSPDGRLVAYGAFGTGRSTSDLWVTDLDGGTTRRLTDDENDSNDPQWSADGATVAYSASAPGGKDLLMRKIRGGEPSVLATRAGTQFASDWLRDGSALLVTEETERNRRDIIVQPADGSTAWPYAATAADETAARVSPDGRWVAYTSDESGRAEVYLDSYPRPGRRVAVSSGGGVHPVWRGDGRELYYWSDGSAGGGGARAGRPRRTGRR